MGVNAEQEELLGRLSKVVAYRAAADAELLKLIYRLWLTGASWARIARVLGVSRQSANATWQKRCQALHRSAA